MVCPPVFVSTGGFKSSALDAVRFLQKSGLTHIELSGGKCTPGMQGSLRKLSPESTFQLHNYFPPPEVPFVLNLCDPDPVGRARSLSFVCAAIELGVEFGSRTYSFHAGFLGTPAVTELGGTWKVADRLGVDQGIEIFVAAVQQVHEFAQERGVQLLVENNVLNGSTSEACGEDILLMTSPTGIRAVMNLLPPGVQLLLDVAHLRVSARTLGFDQMEALRDLTDLIGGYHLSDNDGLADCNEPVRDDSWFWGALSSEVGFVTLEVNPAVVGSFPQQVALVKAKMA